MSRISVGMNDRGSVTLGSSTIGRDDATHEASVVAEAVELDRLRLEFSRGVGAWTELRSLAPKASGRLVDTETNLVYRPTRGDVFGRGAVVSQMEQNERRWFRVIGGRVQFLDQLFNGRPWHEIAPDEAAGRSRKSKRRVSQ